MLTNLTTFRAPGHRMHITCDTLTINIIQTILEAGVPQCIIYKETSSSQGLAGVEIT